MSIAPDILDRLKDNDPTLVELDITKIELLDDDADTLGKALAKNTHLTKFTLSYGLVSTDAVRFIANGLAENTSLQELHLEGNSLGDDGAGALAEMLKTNTTLTTLNIQRNGIGPAGAGALAASLEQNKTLIELNIGSNRIHDSGVKALTESLVKNLSLARLGLAENELGQTSTGHLVDLLKTNSSIMELDLQRNVLGNVGAFFIAQIFETNTRLVNVYLQDTNFNPTDIKRLGKALVESKEQNNANLINVHLYSEQAPGNLKYTDVLSNQHDIKEVCTENRQKVGALIDKIMRGIDNLVREDIIMIKDRIPAITTVLRNFGFAKEEIAGMLLQLQEKGEGWNLEITIPPEYKIGNHAEKKPKPHLSNIVAAAAEQVLHNQRGS